MPPSTAQFNNAVQYVNTATSTHTTGEACKAAVEASAASLLSPTAMCELVLNLRAPDSLWRTLSELYTLRKLEYHRTVPGGPYPRPICTERDFQACWNELVAPVELDPLIATALPKATGISWAFASWVKYILSRPGLVRSINRSFPLTFMVPRDAYPVAGGNWTQVTISLANLDRLARPPHEPLGVEHGQLRSQGHGHPWDVVLGGCGRALRRYSSHQVPFTRSSFILVNPGHRSLEATLD